MATTATVLFSERLWLQAQTIGQLTRHKHWSIGIKSDVTCPSIHLTSSPLITASLSEGQTPMALNIGIG